ncbi:MAG: tetratricopeptide repeat protein, partial [Pseudanabaena sp.]
MMTVQYQAALDSYAEGRYEEAMQQFSELLHEDPHNPKLHIWLGATFRKAGKIEYAKEQYQQVLTITDDPDLLDLASTYLAQIQNKLSSQKTESAKAVQQDLDSRYKLHDSSSQQEKTLVIHPPSNGNLGINRLANKALTSNIPSNYDVSEGGGVETLLVSSNILNNNASQPQNAIKVSNGAVPPPSIAVKFDNKQPSIIHEEKPRESLVFGEEPTEIFSNSSITSSVLKDTSANIQNSNPKEKKAKQNKKSNPQAEFPSLYSKDFNDASKQGNSVNFGAKQPIKSSSSAISLEDMLKFSTVGQKITLWGTLVATIPAVILGITAYKVGDSLLLSKVRQGQQSEAIALAKTTENFLQKQTGDVGVLKTLLVSAEVGQNTLQNSAITTNPSEPNK